jgi:hypothetical protein
VKPTGDAFGNAAFATTFPAAGSMRMSASSVTAQTDPPPAATPNRRPCSTGTVAFRAPVPGSLRVTTSWFGCVAQTPPSPTATHHAARTVRTGRVVGVASAWTSSWPAESQWRSVCGGVTSSQIVEPSPAAPGTGAAGGAAVRGFALGGG